MRRILVIRLGALGDFVLSFGPFAAIRAKHPDAEITLLTTPPFAALAKRAPWFDRVEIDARPSWWNPFGVLRLARRLRGYDFVYDLQTSRRSSLYFRLAGRPPWSGIAAKCTHPHDNPLRDVMHTRERQREQLEMAGITDFPTPELGWLDRPLANPSVAGLPHPYALLVPGASPQRRRKRWPAECYGALAAILVQRGLTPVITGTSADTKLAAIIRDACPQAMDLTGRTDLADLFSLARGAAVAIGNDTGPMHLAALAGCPAVVLFSADSDPALTAPRGPDGSWPRLLRVADLSDLPVERVAAALP